jgi:glycosyltransferase involved in cell wall biosynthesis
MSAFNEQDRIHLAIESILKQTFQDFEFIIVDDGSTDDTKQILNAYTRKDNRIKVLETPNQGLTKALNIGLELADAEFIARQDANDISYPTRLERQFNYLQEHPGIVLLGSDFEIIADNGCLLSTIRNSKLDRLKDKIEHNNPFCHGSIIFKGVVGNCAVSYDEFYKTAQDYDLICRLSEKGKIAILPEVLYRWTLSDLGIQSSNVIFFSRRARENHINRKTGKPENFEKPNYEQIKPMPSSAHILLSKGICCLSGYEKANARSYFLQALKLAKRFSRQHLSCLGLLLVCFFPKSILASIREKHRIKCLWFEKMQRN